MNAPKWLTWLGVLALLWNLMGLAAAMMDALSLGPPLPAEQAEFVAATPVWAIAGTWLAVGAGFAGSFALILRKGWAVAAFALSLAGLVMQDAWFAMNDIVATFGTTPLIMQGVVLLIAVALLWLAVSARNRGWLN
jgi:hypothetical protein